ncbi:MAG: hypothetical protein HZB29_10380 [Nitrospinae bacterium]|nr:hypothetical protein [Nitrospinota bacterium]
MKNLKSFTQLFLVTALTIFLGTSTSFADKKKNETKQDVTLDEIKTQITDLAKKLGIVQESLQTCQAPEFSFEDVISPQATLMAKTNLVNEDLDISIGYPSANVPTTSHETDNKMMEICINVLKDEYKCCKRDKTIEEGKIDHVFKDNCDCLLKKYGEKIPMADWSLKSNDELMKIIESSYKNYKRLKNRISSNRHSRGKCPKLS